MKKQIRKFFSFFISMVLFMNTFVTVMAHPYDVSDELALRNACKIATKYDCSRIAAPGFNKRNLENFKYLCERGVVQVDNVLKDVSIRYTLHKQMLKEDFILHSKEACNSFLLKYYISDFEAYQLDAQTILLYDKNQNKEVVITAPYMEDASGKRSRNICLKINSINKGILIASLTADYNWLQSPERQYPVRIDPEYRFPENDLQEGNSGDDVYVLKNMLFEAGFGAGIPKNEVLNDMQSNVYTSITRKFVEVFQEKRRLSGAKKGVADKITRDELRSYLEKEKHVLDTAEHIKEFSKRINKRSQKRGFLSRINKADVVTSLAVSVGSIALGITCLPFVATGVGIAGVVAGCVAMGSVANGVSEVVQQRQAGKKIDIGRVAIKSTFGAVQGALSAIPGVSMGKAVGSALSKGGQVLVEGIAANQMNTVTTGIFSATTSKIAGEITLETAKQAALETGKVLVKAGVKEVAISTVATVGTNTVGNIACKAKSGEKIDKEAVIDSISQGLADAAMIPVGAVVNVAAISVLGDKKCPQNEENKEKDKDEKKEKQKEDEIKEEILHKELFSEEKIAQKTENLKTKFDIIKDENWCSSEGFDNEEKYTNYALKHLYDGIEMSEGEKEGIKTIHKAVKDACNYKGTDKKEAAKEEARVCLEMRSLVEEILGKNPTKEQKETLKAVRQVLDNRMNILVLENGLLGEGGPGVMLLQGIQGASQAMASLGTLAGPVGVTLGAVLTAKSLIDNRDRIIYNSKAIGYRVAKTWENSGLMHRKRESFSTFEKREVERFKQNHQINHTTPPQTQIHSKPHKQKVVHKPPTQSKKTHTSQKVNKIPKGKSRKITVKAGDTPSGLAKKYGVSVEDVMKGAGITDPRKLIAGKTITVTNGGGSVSKTKQSKSTVTNTDKSQSPKKNGGSQPPPPPEPPKKPDDGKIKRILDDVLKGTAASELANDTKKAVESNPEIGEKIAEVEGVITEVATEAKDKVVEVIPEIVGEVKETTVKAVETLKNTTKWDMPECGKCVNGRHYTQHALERMAPDTIGVRAELTTRAKEVAIKLGYDEGSSKYLDFIKKYVQPRNIPPMVVEDTIKNGIKSAGDKLGTFEYLLQNIKVIVNSNGDVITVIPQ